MIDYKKNIENELQKITETPVFGGTAMLKKRDITRYTAFRPPYPQQLIDALVSEFHLDKKGRLLDLGCGSGQITFPLAPYFEHTIALDVDPLMIQEAQLQAQRNHRENIEWHVKPAEDVSQEIEGTLRLVTIATAFHWMDRPLVLQKCYDLLEENGGIAIVNAKSWWDSSATDWQQDIMKLIKKYLGPERRDKSPAKTSKISHEELLINAQFKKIQNFTITAPYEWTTDNILGYLFSTAYCAPSLFGSQLKDFEVEVRALLLSRNAFGTFHEDLPFYLLVGHR